MRVQCATDQREFQGLGSRRVVVAFDGGTLSSDADGLLLREIDARSGILDRFAECFTDRRERGSTEHTIRELVGQRIYGLCLGYEDLNDHDQLRYDPLFAAVCGQPDVEVERADVRSIAARHWPGSPRFTALSVLRVKAAGSDVIIGSSATNRVV